MKTTTLFFCFVILSLNLLGQRNITLLDSDWKFNKADNSLFAQKDYEDKNWERVNIPHDWAIAGPFDMTIDTQKVMVIEDGEKIPKLRTGRTGSLPFVGVGWYRKDIDFTNSDKDKQYFVEFDGVMSNAQVFVNGELVKINPYGYSSFDVNITPYINFEGSNLIAVRAENKPLSSRWYPGAGIYRNVRLVEASPLHIAHWGTYVTTSVINDKDATVNIQTSVNNLDASDTDKVHLVTTIIDNRGNKVAEFKSKIDEGTISQQFDLSNVSLWSIESPNMYRAISKIYNNDKLSDTYETNFGIRSIRFDADKGFFLNEKPVKMKGVCLHHDLGPLGAAVNYRAIERQLEMLKEMGCNAIRTSHNMPAPELLELCDQMGFLVMDECFDEWKMSKNANGYGQYFDDWAEKDIVSMIHRDRNHPCIIMWSTGNEVREQSSADGGKTARFLYDIVHREDPTRPITVGLNEPSKALKNGFSDAVDILGFNYKPFMYKDAHQKYTQHTILGAETASTVSSRGVYHFPVKEFRGEVHDNFHSSSYDLEFPNWASTPDTEFAAQDDCDFVLGEFVWTGFDYLGEPTPYGYEGTPSRSSYFGIIDLAGLKKDRFYIYQSKWSDTPVLHILPHWSWEDRVGKITPVHCYTNYPSVELFLNGKSLGRKTKDATKKYERFRIVWNDVVYQPGELKAVAYDDKGQKIAEQIVKTAGEPDRIIASPDRKTISANGKDLSFIEVSVVDKDGNLCPNSDALLNFNVSGSGEYIAACNGDPTSHTSFVSKQMNAFSGKCVMIVGYSTKPGNIKVTIESKGLKPAQVVVSASR